MIETPIPAATIGLNEDGSVKFDPGTVKFADPVNHPPHYNSGKIEVIDYLEDQFMSRPHEWNAVKYLSRSDKKGREIEDLKKAIWYIERKISLLKAKQVAK